MQPSFFCRPSEHNTSTKFDPNRKVRCFQRLSILSSSILSKNIRRLKSMLTITIRWSKIMQSNSHLVYQIYINLSFTILGTRKYEQILGIEERGFWCLEEGIVNSLSPQEISLHLSLSLSLSVPLYLSHSIWSPDWTCSGVPMDVCHADWRRLWLGFVQYF